MTPTLHFPVYVIAGRDGVVVVTTDGGDCIMLFHGRELAEEQIAKIRSTHPLLGALHALAIPNAEALRDGLKDLPSDVTCAVWDPTGQSDAFESVCLDELLTAGESR